jgi:hypothetical protein
MILLVPEVPVFRLVSSLVAAAAVVFSPQTTGSVRVTATKANVRAEMSETSAILTQVNKDTLLDLLSVEAEWFHVRLQMGAMRVDAYISKKVAKLEAGAPGPAGAASVAVAAKPKPEATPSRDSMTVGLMVDSNVSWLQPNTARLIQIGDKVDSIAKAGPSIPAGDALPSNASGSTQITYVWVADGASASKVTADHRPSFYVQFKDVPGLSPDDLAPMLVRLTPAASGVRVVGAVRGRADQATRIDADWDVIKDFKQDVLKAEVQLAERGIVRLVATQDLPPGQYAVVMRLTSKKKLSGAGVLQSSGEARLFGVVWDFAVK